MEYLRNQFEMSKIIKMISPAGPGISSATDRFESAHNDDNAPNMAKNPLVIQQLKMLSLWLQENDGEVLRKEAATTMINVIFDMYGMAEDLRSPLLIILEQCRYTPGGIDDIRDRDGWNSLVSDLESIALSHDPDDAVVKCGIIIIDILGPVSAAAVKNGKDKSEWKQFARIAVQLDTEGSAEQLDLKASVVMLAIDLICQTSSALGRGSALRKKLLAMPSRLLTVRDRMKEATHEDLDHYVETARLLSLGMI
ncbi:MAG: hypothetical protein Q9209_001013 [Squamulea sp. 1 TL-2023]